MQIKKICFRVWNRLTWDALELSLGLCLSFLQGGEGVIKFALLTVNKAYF